MAAIPKGRPWALMLADRKKARTSIDEQESAKVRKRSGGQCEAVIRARVVTATASAGRCRRRAVHVHHMLGGNGTRGRGESAKAIRKQHLCDRCHEEERCHVLIRQGGPMPHWTDSYVRLK